MLKRQMIFTTAMAAFVGVATASFVVPEENNPPFRRDRLPINSEQMISLSRDLSILAQSLPLSEAKERRSAAQALALAVALDPANQGARDILSALSDGDELDRPNSKKIEVAKSRIWKSYEWLSLAQAGSDGNTLASLLEQPAYVLDPEREKSSENQVADSLWSGWVAPISAFELKTDNEPDPIDEIASKNTDPQNELEPRGDGTILLTEAQVETVVHTYDDALEKWVENLYPVKMSASTKAPKSDDDSNESSKSFAISVQSSSSESFRVQRNIVDPIEAALLSRGGKLPKMGEIKILPGANGGYSYRRNLTRLTGPGFILANSALTGVEPNGLILAELDDSSKLKLPTYFWKKLSKISEVKGKKIILPKGSEKILVNLLILDKPEFFLNNEVLLGATNEQFIKLCSKKRSPEQEAIHQKFQEIVEKANGNPIGPYLANRYVRQRLEEIVKAAPYHLSAKLLVLQGSPVRPRYLSKEVLAAEVWRAIDPLGAAIGSGLEPSHTQQLDQAYNSMREEIESLEKHTDLRSQGVINEAKDLLSKTRSYMRTLRGSGELWERMDEILEARKELIKTNNEVRESLSEISGEPLPEELEKTRRRSRRDR
ncbi:MAG: hypothetical protein AB8D78_10450 [Akkermansiaceae bacterium]